MVTTSRPKVVAGLRLVALVGRGGEGEVWEARTPNGRRRALKLIRPELLADPREVAIRGGWLRRIDHPALVRVHRTGRLAGSSLEGWGFVEMDFVDGQSLAEADPEPGALERLESLAAALDLLHLGEWSDGVPLVHRDVKPANLISTPQGRLVLVDCSTLRGADATQLTRVGTPVYCAPEVLTGRMGPPADVYSFAVTVVALVTGARGDELVELLDDAWALDLPDAVQHALSPHPENRPASCRAVLRSGATIRLPGDRWAWDEEAEGFEPATTGDRPSAWPSRRLWPWVVLLAVLAATGLAAWLSRGGPLGIALVAGGIAVHLVSHAVARRPVSAALLVPPVAWAFLLAARAAPPGRRRAWLRTVLSAVLTAPVVLAARPLVDSAAAVGIGPVTAATVLALLGVCYLLGVWHLQGVAGVLLRLAAAPLWLAGAALLIAGGLALLPLAFLAGRAREALGLVAGTVTGALAFWKRPAIDDIAV